MRYIGFILVLLTVLSSCDSREDWFAREGIGTSFIIKSYKSAWWQDEEKYEFRNDTVYNGNNRVVEYNLKLNDVRLLSDNEIVYKSDAIHLDVEGFGVKVKRTYKDVSLTTDLTEPSCVELEDNWYYFLGFDNGVPVTILDTVAPVLNTAHLSLEFEDAFRNTFYCHVKINFLGDIAPVPMLEIKDVDGNSMEKVFDLSKSYDKDGSVEKYEFCIDGEIVDYNSPTFDCRQDVAPAGKGAYGGTYITSTSLSEVKHAFQKEGEHVVYYRCMDNLGLWSLWYNKLITVNK